MTTKEDIQTSINSRLTTLPTQIEGGSSQDIIGSVSYELANIIDTKIDTILDNAFVTTADEEHLLIKGKELGIVKKDGQCAFVWAKITNAAPNTYVASGIQAKTADNIFFQSITDVITDENGCTFVKMECLEAGSAGNIEAGKLVDFAESYTGFEKAEITNPEKGYDGFDAEDTEEYRQRILEYIQNNACNSNIEDYKTWAKSVQGVKEAVIKDAFTAGAGHVDVYISATDGEVVSDELIQNVKNKIQEEQIVNAIVNVYSLQYVQIDVTANVALKDGYSEEDVRADFVELLKNYLDENPKVISYLYISNLFFKVEGINDITNYLLNGQQSTLFLTSLQTPFMGNITFIPASGEEETL